jgi:hypothetical protein
MGNAQMQPAAKPVETRSLALDEASDGSLKDMALSDDLNKRRQENVLADTAKSAARDLLAGKGGTPGGPLLPTPSPRWRRQILPLLANFPAIHPLFPAACRL